MAVSAALSEHPTPPGLKPFDPRRLPFYYGWVIAVVAAVGTIASIPGQTAGVSVFTDHLTEATGLSRLNLSLAYLVGTGISGVLLPRAGRWIDRVGARVTALIATFALAITLTALSFVDRMGLWTGLAVMTIGFGGLRFSGQGLLTLSSRTMLSQWFDKRRGLVSSVSSSAIGFFFSASPTLLYALIAASDFRWAWRQMALGLVVIVGAIIFVFYRDSPESCGMTIDGGPSPASTTQPFDGQTASASPRVPADATRSQALRDLRFWAFTIPVAASAAASTALTFHIVDFGREMGISEAEIIAIFIPVAFVSIPISIISGWLVDRFPPTILAGTMSAFQVAMYVTVAMLDLPVMRPFAVFSWGASQGFFVALTSAAIPKVFGRTHLGAISGIQMSMIVIGSAVGPAFFSLMQNFVGTYASALYALTLVPLVGIVAAVESARRYGLIR